VNTILKRKNRVDDLHASRLSFWIISLMHDNPLLPAFRKPYRLLEAAGLRKEQVVMEVGCGPGFFTIPASKIVGKDGLIYALDVNPWAIKAVDSKIRKYGIENVKPLLANAACSGLPASSIDISFIFGLRHVAGGLSGLLSETHRILKAGGIVSFEKTSGSDDILVEEVERAGFTKIEKKGRIFVFAKRGNIPE